ncbi:MAG TPA: hypothetical protein VMZ52_17375 [Bryobacteraceae bacterium]|nr:hypothetical protein [Bryobacteraceae bacterium]
MPVESVREFYLWQPPDKAFSVQINFDVIDRINREVMRGFGAVRRRGTEVGGLLLGTIIPGSEPIITIYDFEPVPCEYAMGPSYLLSENDLLTFRQVLNQWSPSAGHDMYAVGFFRSHTRDGLEAQEEDLKLFAEQFPDAANVLLLIKPFASKPSVAGFLFREQGAIRSATPYLEFPFRSTDLGSTTSSVPPAAPHRENHDNAVEPVHHKAQNYETKPILRPVENYETNPSQRNEEALRQAPMFAGFQPTPSRWSSRIGWLVLSIALVALGAVAGFQYAGGEFSTVSSAPDPYAMTLSAARVDDNVLVKWDRGCPAIRSGWRGLLTISEGQDSKIVQLDVPQLQNGSVLYRHIAPEIHFKLEVFLKEQRSVIETQVFRMKQ